jgi:hypothetical protein
MPSIWHLHCENLSVFRKTLVWACFSLEKDENTTKSQGLNLNFERIYELHTTLWVQIRIQVKERR